MSMFNDVLGLGRSSISESMFSNTFEPEIANMALENAADINEDPMEFMLKVAYENEMNMMKLDQAIIAEEYIYLRENGVEMVDEAGKIGSVVTKFKEMVKSLWNRIQSFFKSVFNKFADIIKLDEKFVKKYEEAAKGKKCGKIKVVKAYFTNFDNNVEAFKNLMGNISKKANGFNVTTANKDSKDSLLKDLIAETSISQEAVIKAINAELSKKSEEVSGYSADDAITIIKNSKTYKNDITKLYNTNKSMINGLLKNAKIMEREAKRSSDDNSSKTASNIHSGIAALNSLGTLSTMVDRVAISVINKGRSIAKAIVLSAIKNGKSSETGETGKTGETPANESFIDSLEF